MTEYKPHTINELISEGQHDELVEIRGAVIHHFIGSRYVDIVISQDNSRMVLVYSTINKNSIDEANLREWKGRQQHLQIKGLHIFCIHSIVAHSIKPLCPEGSLSLVERMEGGELSLATKGELSLSDEE